VEVTYRKLFLKDLKRLKGSSIYDKIFKIVFEDLPKVDTIFQIKGLRPLKGSDCRYRIRVGDYRIGIEVHGDRIEVMRVLHRKDFYKFFP